MQQAKQATTVEQDTLYSTRRDKTFMIYYRQGVENPEPLRTVQADDADCAMRFMASILWKDRWHFTAQEIVPNQG